MEINRNQYFMMGLLLLFLGIQLRLIDSYYLTEKATAFLAEHFHKSSDPVSDGTTRLLRAAGPPMRKIIHPPDWLGWCLMSIGSVLVLHSLAMPRPAG